MVRELKSIVKKLILIVIITSVIMSSFAVPKSYAKLTIKEGEFYYAGTTKGSYKPSEGIFSWAFNLLKELAAFLITLIPNAVRMSFVGYTALAEKVLTWALETTAGVNLAGEDVSATDLTKLTDSTNNVTVQAIVYNMVPALNVNFFDLEYKDMYKKTIKEKDADGNLVEKTVLISPTGQQLICKGKNCGKSVLECCEWQDGRKEVKCYNDSCNCKNCDACQKYVQLMLAQDPIIIQLKKLIAVWYYIIRLLAVAAMCVVLIAVGIKMAVSTIASDKAVYKRMLVDWVAGMILIFTMHYIMYFSIIVTDILVNTVRESANQVNKVSMMQLSDTSKDKDEIEKSNQDLEIDVYEEIRTRAYDFNLIIGLMGMIMYITLVFMAFKYTLIYIKRFLTLAVLTLMAPGIGVAYALQKVLSGKSSSLKSWLTEYLLNLLIQVVHALMYAIFISAALKYSLENISGVLIALILMNFSLKGEAIFRRIFNLDPGNKGLLGSTETAGDRDKLMKNAKAMKAMAVGAKPLAKAVTAPGRIVLGGAAKAGAAGLLMGGALAKDKVSSLRNNNSSNNEDSEVTRSTSTGGNSDSGEGGEEGAVSRGSAGAAGTEQGKGSGTSTGETPASVLDKAVAEHGTGKTRVKPKRIGQHQEDLMLLRTGESELKRQLNEAITEYKEDPKNTNKLDAALEANRKLERYREVSAKNAEDLNVRNVVVGHVSNMFDINNYFDVKIAKDGSIKHVPKKGAVFGSYKYDSKTGRFVKDKSNAAYTQFGAAKLLGFSDKDKKIFKDQVWKPAVKGIGGMASMFLGMGNLVAHPMIGMGMLAGGAGMTGSALNKFRKPAKGSPGRLQAGLKLAKDPNAIFPNIPIKRLRFGSFETPTMVHMRDEVINEANKELSEKLNRYVQRTHPDLISKIRDNKVVPKTVGFVLAPVATLGIVGVNALRNSEQDPKNGRYADIDNPYQYGTRKEVLDSEKVRLHPIGTSAWDIVDKQHFEQVAQQKLTFIDEANALINQREISDAKVKVELINQTVDKKIDEADLKEYSKMLVESWAARGYDYDSKTGQITPKTDVEESDIRQNVKINTKDEAGQSVVQIKRITDRDVKTVNKKIDEIISRKLDGREIDVSSEKMMSEIITDLSSELAREGIIGQDQSADILFEQGIGKLKTTIKHKATQANNIVKESQEYKLNTQEFDAVQQAILEVAKESASADGEVDLSKIDQAKVLSKVQESLKGSQPPVDGKDKPKGKLEGKLDAKIGQISESEKYQTAISTLLASKDGATQNVINNNLMVNVKDSDAMNRMSAILSSQNQLNTALIRDRVISTEGTISKASRKVSDKENRTMLKRNLKKQIADVVEKYSQDVVSVEDTETKETKEIVSREEKLRQAEAATAGLDSISRDAVLNSLFVITGMEENIKALNTYGDETLVETSKYKKPTNKNQKKHLRAQMDVTDAEIALKKAQKELLLVPEGDTKKKLNITKEIDKATKKLEVAKEISARTGPVQDVRKATNDVLSLLIQKRY